MGAFNLLYTQSLSLFCFSDESAGKKAIPKNNRKGLFPILLRNAEDFLLRVTDYSGSISGSLSSNRHAILLPAPPMWLWQYHDDL